MASDFLKENVARARKLGEKMGTTSPYERSPSNIKSGPEFLKENVREARKLGEKMGTTSPHGGRKTQSKSEGKWKPSDVKSGGITKEKTGGLGEKMGTTSPRVSHTKTKSAGKSSGIKSGSGGPKERARAKEISVPKSKVPSAKGEFRPPQDFLKETVSQAREVGEKMGTTSPHGGRFGKTELSSQVKSGPDFLKENVSQARKLGEKMGTTSPIVS